jgi:formate dehydrogenase
MHVGTVAAGRIGLAVLRRLKSFDMHLPTHCTCGEAS